MLELDGVHTFRGHGHVLQGVSLQIGEGEVVALLGRNGAGKTTTVTTIVGFTPARSGRIRFKGRDITHEAPHKIARDGLTIVPQDRRLFPQLTVQENLVFGVRGRCRASSGKWTLEAIYELFPNLRGRRKHRAYQLSGGEQQMVAIGRALMTQPDLILMDEPSEGLAPQLVERVESVLERLKQGRGVSVLLIEQNLALPARTADRGYVLEKGRIKLECSAEDLLDAEDLLALS